MISARTPVSNSICAERAWCRACASVGGAAIAAVTGGDIATYALAGATAGGLAGYFVDKNDGCDGYDRNGYLDDDCFGTSGYPVDPR